MWIHSTTKSLTSWENVVPTASRIPKWSPIQIPTGADIAHFPAADATGWVQRGMTVDRRSINNNHRISSWWSRRANAHVWETWNTVQKHAEPPSNHLSAAKPPGTVLNWYDSFVFIFQFATRTLLGRISAQYLLTCAARDFKASSTFALRPHLVVNFRRYTTFDMEQENSSGYCCSRNHDKPRPVDNGTLHSISRDF